MNFLARTVAFLLTLCCILDGNAAEYDLVLERRTIQIDGIDAKALTINGTVPGPTLNFKEGEQVVVRVRNLLKEPSALHWHGLLVPGDMDGVPGLNGFPGIEPGATFTYRFTVRQSGTYWYHSHGGTQEQSGLYAPIIIEPRDPDPIKVDRDYTLLLSDFTDVDGMEILRNLKNDHEHYNRGRRTLADFIGDVAKDGWGTTIKDRADWGEMRMDPTDMSDVSDYTFLVNGKTARENWTGIFKAGERIRLRFINGSAMSFMDVRIPGLKMIVVQADGQNIEPVVVDEFRVAPAETYDVVVSPREDAPFTIFAEPIDRTGFAHATLAPGMGMQAELPERRPRAILTMADIGMAHAGHGAESTAENASTHSHHEHKEAPSPPIDAPAKPRGWANAATPANQRALKYADLKSLALQRDTRAPTREIVVRLGGSMTRYIWTLNGHAAEHTAPIELKYNGRVKLTFVNESMMAHPMHLHGMFVQLLNGQPAERLPNKHTVTIEPGKSYSVLLTADEPGEWAFHCHLLYHMVAGMMTKVVVAKLTDEAPR